MTTWLLLIYLAIGVANVVVADLQGRLIITRPGKRRAGKAQRDWPSGIVEAIFYVLCWPVQLAFWLTARISNLISDRWPS